MSAQISRWRGVSAVESFAHFLLALAAGGMRNASFKHLSGDSWGECCVTVGDGVNRVDEVVLGDVLEQEAAGSGRRDRQRRNRPRRTW